MSYDLHLFPIDYAIKKLKERLTRIQWDIDIELWKPNFGHYHVLKVISGAGKTAGAHGDLKYAVGKYLKSTDY